MLAFAGAIAHAEPPARLPDETIIIVDDAPREGEGARDRERALGEAPFVTVLHPDDHPATASVADALATTAGAQTRSLGGLGAYQSVSVRGAAPGHTAVLIDGVPLARIAAVTTDLGRFALDSFGQVELYRGAVPIELGGAGVGGAVNLVTRLGRGEHGERVRASAGFGSFGARHLRAHYGDDHGRVKSSTTIGYQGADGDYTYFDDNGTLLNQHDDGYRVRGNNGFDQLDAATRLGTDTGAGGLRLAYKDQGLPGSTAQPAAAASLATLDVIADGNGSASVGRATAKQLGFVMFERQRLADPMGELGLGPAERTYLTLSGGASSTWSVPIATHRFVAGGELRGDRFVDRDERKTQPELTGTRAGGAVTVAVDVGLAPQLVVTPAMRLDAVRTAPTPMTSGPSALEPVPARWDVVPSPRFTAHFAATSELAFKGSAGWYVRLPTLLEAFGNRGFVVGSPDLRAERGPSADVGVVWAPATARGVVDRILVQADAFATRAHDTIAFVTYGGFVARATNIGDTQTYGGELIASARLVRTLTATASYTRLATEQLSIDTTVDGKPIPRKPPHVLYTRLDAVRTLAGRTATVWIDGAWQAESFLDPAGLGRVPGRLLVGSGLRTELAAGFALALSIANVTDERVSHLPLDPPPSPALTETPTPLTDVAGFPLPGRSFYLSLDWTY